MGAACVETARPVADDDDKAGHSELAVDEACSRSSGPRQSRRARRPDLIGHRADPVTCMYARLERSRMEVTTAGMGSTASCPNLGPWKVVDQENAAGPLGASLDVSPCWPGRRRQFKYRRSGQKTQMRSRQRRAH